MAKHGLGQRQCATQRGRCRAIECAWKSSPPAPDATSSAGCRFHDYACDEAEPDSAPPSELRPQTNAGNAGFSASAKSRRLSNSNRCRSTCPMIATSHCLSCRKLGRSSNRLRRSRSCSTLGQCVHQRVRNEPGLPRRAIDLRDRSPIAPLTLTPRPSPRSLGGNLESRRPISNPATAEATLCDDNGRRRPGTTAAPATPKCPSSSCPAPAH